MNPSPHAFDTASRPGVGVVIPAYNRRTILLETLASVARQTRPPAELVVADDGSTDGTADAAENWLHEAALSFPWRVLRLPHQSAGSARNAGLQRLRACPYVAFLDSDDHWPADFLARAVDALERVPQAVAATADRAFSNSQGERMRLDDLRNLAANPLEWIFQHDAGLASGTVLRTSLIADRLAWPMALHSADDVPYFARVAQLGAWLHLPGPPVTMHQGTAQARSEAGNVSATADNRRLEWASTYEKVYLQLCRGRHGLRHRMLRRCLANRWLIAGQEFLQQGRTLEAKQAIHRALYWRCTWKAAWRLRLQLAFSAAA